MRLLLVIETPEDDDPHSPRIRKALAEYVSRVQLNHQFVYERRIPNDAIGRDGGPNTMACSNDCLVTEARIDGRYFWRSLWRWFKRRAT